MRLFTLILSLYFLALSCYPCADTVCETTSIAEEQHHNDDHEHHEENCSPFCYCHCCHLSTLGLTMLDTEANEYTYSSIIIGKETNFYQDVSYRFFQPPRHILTHFS